MAHHTIRIVVALLLLSGSLGAQAAGTAGTDAGNAGAEQKRADARETRRGPALDAVTGVVFVMTGDEIRRTGVTPVRSVPGMDIVGRVEGAMQSR
jgi:hypothetical protein